MIDGTRYVVHVTELRDVSLRLHDHLRLVAIPEEVIDVCDGRLGLVVEVERHLLPDR